MRTITILASLSIAGQVEAQNVPGASELTSGELGLQYDEVIVTPSALVAGQPEAQDVPRTAEEISDEIGLQFDDTIFTTSARTKNFNGQGIISRFMWVEKTDTYDGNSRKSDPLDREIRVLKWVNRAIIGFHEDVTVALTVPLVDKQMKTTVGGSRQTLNASGIGDIMAMAKWRFLKEQGLGETTEASFLFGLKLPTGRNDVRDGGMRLPPMLQPGTGSLDTVLGAAFTRLWDGGRWLLNADVFYRANSEANDYRFGNVASFDVGGQYRILPYLYESFDEFTLNGILEVNVEYADRDTLVGNRVGGTGGTKVFVSPGLQAIVTPNFLVESGIQIPVYRHLGGLQPAEDFRFLFGLRLLF